MQQTPATSSTRAQGRRAFRAAVACWLSAATACSSEPAARLPARAEGALDAGAVSLFNGVDLDGWDRYLGKPTDAEPAIGVDSDPRGVYSVVMIDGEPAIRISGEIWGALISRQELGDFHLRAEYRWGTSTWPPLRLFDSGIMYLSTGPLGAVNAGGPALSDPVGSGAFMVSMEYQVLPGDVGGCYALGPIRFQAAPRSPARERTGEWNQIDIVHESGEARHFLNGELVAGGSDFQLEWPGEAAVTLRRGKLQIQSEGAEIFYRRIQLSAPP